MTKEEKKLLLQELTSEQLIFLKKIIAVANLPEDKRLSKGNYQIGKIIEYAKGISILQ